MEKLLVHHDKGIHLRAIDRIFKRNLINLKCDMVFVVLNDYTDFNHHNSPPSLSVDLNLVVVEVDSR